jgi:hypothetical protein
MGPSASSAVFDFTALDTEGIIEEVLAFVLVVVAAVPIGGDATP